MINKQKKQVSLTYSKYLIFIQVYCLDKMIEKFEFYSNFWLLIYKSN